MTLVKVLTIIFILFASSRAVLRFRDKTLSFGGLIFWLLIWFFVFIFAAEPNLSDRIAKVIGLSRGVDAIFFSAIILIFYLVFRMYIKIDEVDKNLTELSVKISKFNHQLKKK